jgi:hypothetical protein
MSLPITTATISLESMAPYSQSRKHDLPKLKGELPDAYELRTWRDHLTVKDNSVVIPQFALHQCIVSAARYSKRQISGQGRSTWTAKFTSGIVLFNDIMLNIDPETVGSIDINAHVNGTRGSGKRVTRRFPIITAWKATFDLCVLDPIVTQDVLTEMLEIAGLFIGIGRYRPENGGSNGRFQPTRIVWTPAVEGPPTADADDDAEIEEGV